MIIPDKEYFEHPIVTPRYLSKNWPEFYEYLRKEYPDIKSIGAALYMWRHNMKSSPKCPVCGKETRFFGYTKGYGVCCSTKCSNSYSAKKYKTKEVCLEKYGVDNPSKNKDVKNKAKETSLKKYGVDNPSKSQEIKDKISRSCLERFGIRIPARKCTIRQISAKESNILLDNNHIQGGCSGSCRYGLYNKDNKLVSTMVFAKNRNKVLGGKKDNSAWELVRYCCEGGVQII